MANIPLQSISFPGLSDKYTTPTVDATLTQTGAAADAKKTGDKIAELKNDLNQLESAFVVETETGAIASFTDGADDVPVKDLTVAIEPVQSGSGDPSPSNVRPISGWTGANVTACGINVWDEEWEVGRIDTTTGEPLTLPNGYHSKNFITITGTPLYIKSADGNLYICEYGVSKNYLRYASYFQNEVYTPHADAKYIKFHQVNKTTYNHDISINYPSTDHDYHAYNGSSVSIDWTTEAGTVYGGTLDVTTGVLTVDSIMFNMTSIVTFPGITEGGKRITFSAPQTANSYNVTENGLISNRYKASNYTLELNNSVFMPNTNIIAISSSEVIGTNNAEVIAYFATNDTVISYKVATPTTYHLAPEEVKTVLGQNNIFADTGDVTAQYRADTKLYIDKVLNA